MLDEDATPWLIEVNSSPAMDYSTPVTSELVKEVLIDSAKVMVDYFYASKRDKPKVNTGNWQMIHKSKRQVEKPQASFGLNLMCEGKSIKR
jgi:tubulin monoglycylase TTLL3/8